MKLVFISISYPWSDMSSPGWPSTWWPGVLQKKETLVSIHYDILLEGDWTKCLKVMFKDESTSSERVLTPQLLLLKMAFFQAKGDVIAFIDCHCAPQDQWHKVRVASRPHCGNRFWCILRILQYTKIAGWKFPKGEWNFVLRCKIFQPVVSDDWMTIWCYNFCIQFQMFQSDYIDLIDFISART